MQVGAVKPIGDRKSIELALGEHRLVFEKLPTGSSERSAGSVQQQLRSYNVSPQFGDLVGDIYVEITRGVPRVVAIMLQDALT